MPLDPKNMVLLKPIKDKVLCQECGWFGHNEDVLAAENPFDKDEMVYGCPKCKSVDSVISACDAPGCWKKVTCGWPHPDGYRNTCSDHYRVKGVTQSS